MYYNKAKTFDDAEPTDATEFSLSSPKDEARVAGEKSGTLYESARC